MNLFIQAATLLAPSSALHLCSVDVHILDGVIRQIAAQLSPPDSAHRIDATGKYLSAGFMDLCAFSGEPGFEHREDLHSLAAAAAAGGFTAIAVMPNTQPVTQSKADITYILNKTAAELVSFMPIGAITKDCDGKVLTEIYDMQRAGAVAFSDGHAPLQNGGMLLRALQYVLPFGGLVINMPHDDTLIGGRGQMHEGVQSTLLGMRGAPAIAEELMVQRDLYLLQYTHSRLHLHGISTAGSVALVRQAKQNGLRVTTSISAINLAFDDTVLNDFDSAYKVFPHLREATDIAALRDGLRDGTIDGIASNHTPLEDDCKKLEYQYANFGAIGLETTFAVANEYSGLTANELSERLAYAPRRILGIPEPDFVVNAVADFVLFDTDTEYVLRESGIYSKSKNTPFLDKKLKGKVWATGAKGKTWLNKDF